jgi:2-hydroxy-3-keto-5-methylthiopentenyl-1-phosphate phosphatase
LIQEKRFKVFIDFDGTITATDVGEAMFLEFGDADRANQIIKSWMNNEITSKQTWLQLCKTVKNYDEDRFFSFIDKIQVDPTFYDFEKFCESNNIEMFVLSDGLDIYINRILNNSSLSHLKVYSNYLMIDEQNNLIPSFPFPDEECDKCANCKRNHILDNSSDDDFTIYIGDGFSDTCPAQYCDFIFAKRSLLKYCEINRISFFPFNNFVDVMDRLNQLLNKKRLKKRHQADLKRKRVYLQG